MELVYKMVVQNPLSSRSSITAIPTGPSLHVYIPTYFLSHTYKFNTVFQCRYKVSNSTIDSIEHRLTLYQPPSPSSSHLSLIHSRLRNSQVITMRYVYSLSLVVFLAAVGSTPLCNHSKANHQDVFSHRLHHSELEDDGPIVYLPPGDGAVDLDSMMHDLIAEEMTITYDEAEYVKSLLEKLCSFHQGMFECILEVLEPPTIQVIPTKQVSKDIVCTTATCGIELDESISVSTTNSLEVSLTIEVGGEPFGVGVKFSGTVGYGFSKTKEITTGLKYSFDLERNDTGYIGMVNAQVSSTVRLIACKCKWIDIQCIEGCRDNGPNYNVTGHHEVVVLKDGIPRSYVAFIYTNRSE